MEIFRNLLVFFIIAAVLTRIAKWLLKKIVEEIVACYLSFVIVLVITTPIIVMLFGFDSAIAEYLVSLIVLLIIDLMHESRKKKK